MQLEKFRALEAYIGEKNSQNNKLSFHFKKLEKKRAKYIQSKQKEENVEENSN